jgi:CRP-like cAMP-binding protein
VKYFCVVSKECQQRIHGAIMSDKTVVELLSSAEFFAGMADEHLRRLTEISRCAEYPAHVDIFHEDERAKDVYVIVTGKVSLVICTPKVGCRELMQVTDGELIGWSPLVGRARLSDTAHTLAPTTAIVIDGDRVLALCAEHPDFGFEFIFRVAKVLAERLRATRMQLLDVYGVSLPSYQTETD